MSLGELQLVSHIFSWFGMGLQFLLLIWCSGDRPCRCMTGAAAAAAPDHPKDMDKTEFLISASFATAVSSMGPCLLF